MNAHKPIFWYLSKKHLARVIKSLLERFRCEHPRYAITMHCGNLISKRSNNKILSVSSLWECPLSRMSALIFFWCNVMYKFYRLTFSEKKIIDFFLWSNLVYILENNNLFHLLMNFLHFFMVYGSKLYVKIRLESKPIKGSSCAFFKESIGLDLLIIARLS